MKAPAVGEKTVMVTGCSSGIGEATAQLLRDRGWRVFPTARKEEDVAKLERQGFDAVRLDLAESASVQAAADDCLKRVDGRLGALVNNAGFGQPGALEDVARDVLRYQFEVNVFGMQELTSRCIPAFREQGYGRIVNISSVVGRVSLPFFGAYSATKFAMEALSDAWRVELRGTGVAVSLVEPGPIATRFGDNSAGRAQATLNLNEGPYVDLYRHVIKEWKDKPIRDPFTQPPLAVARKVWHAVGSNRPRTRYHVTVPAYVGALLSRVAPDRFIDWLVATRVQSRISAAHR